MATNPELLEEEVEGLEESEDETSLEDMPNVNPDEYFTKHAFRVVYQTNNFLLPQLRDLIMDGEILNIRPEYQRRLRWTNPQKSKLIESLLLNIPVPPIFLYEAEEARYEVMDGQQRLNAIKEYLEGSFSLSTLSVLRPLNGLRYSKLPPRVKRALDRSSLSSIILLTESDKEKATGTDNGQIDIRRFIFDRLNTGGRKLNAQELRNAIFRGHFNKKVVEMARRREFTDVFGIPPYTEAEPNDYYENPKRQKNALFASMGDCALVLRFFALRDEENIRGSMKEMLDRAMQSRVNCTEAQATELSKVFEDRFDSAVKIFGPRPFLLPPDDKGRQRLSAGLYDSALVALDRNWELHEIFEAQSEGIKQRLAEELKDENQLPILTGKASLAQAVKDRIHLMEKVLFEGAGLN